MPKLSETTEVTIPVKNLLGILAFTTVATTAYFKIDERLTSIEYRADIMMVEIEENDTWIDEFEPPKSVQDNIVRVRELELKIREIEVKMEAAIGDSKYLADKQIILCYDTQTEQHTDTNNQHYKRLIVLIKMRRHYSCDLL